MKGLARAHDSADRWFLHVACLSSRAAGMWCCTVSVDDPIGRPGKHDRASGQMSRGTVGIELRRTDGVCVSGPPQHRSADLQNHMITQQNKELDDLAASVDHGYAQLARQQRVV